MEKITILFITKDIEYGEAFAACAGRIHPQMIFTLMSPVSSTAPVAPTSVAPVMPVEPVMPAAPVIPVEPIVPTAPVAQEYSSKNYDDFDLVIIDSIEESISCDIKFDIKLEEVFNRVPEDYLEHRILYKYDKIENSTGKIINIYCKKSGKPMVRAWKFNGEIIMFFSAAGGMGKTSTALGLAQELVRFHGKRVLYINYEEISSTDDYFKIRENMNIETYLYFIRKKSEKYIDTESFTVSDEYGVKAFSGSKGRNQLKSLDIKELQHFFGVIEKEKVFDYIFLDCDSCLDEKMLWLLSVSDRICMMNDAENLQRDERLKDYLKFKLGEDVEKKIISVCNFCRNSQTAPNGSFTVNLDYDRESFYEENNSDGSRLKKIYIDREFGTGIKQLSSNLTLILQ